MINKTQLVCTTAGTARLIVDDMYFIDKNSCIVEAYKFLTAKQQDDMYNYACTDVSSGQYDNIMELF